MLLSGRLPGGPQAASHLVVELLQTSSTVAILWRCLRGRTPRAGDFLPLSLRPVARAPPALRRPPCAAIPRHTHRLLLSVVRITPLHKPSV